MDDYINQKKTIELLENYETHLKKQRLLDLEIELKERQLSKYQQGMHSIYTFLSKHNVHKSKPFLIIQVAITLCGFTLCVSHFVRLPC